MFKLPQHSFNFNRVIMQIDIEDNLPGAEPIGRKQERITSLDVLRGVAVLGIFWMNIQSFSAPFTAYTNPTAYGDFTGINFWVWAIGHVFVEFKFMTIFSILFGAGVVIFYQRVSEKGLDAVALNTRRMKWLLLFGVIHAYFIWYGDILFTYALCGMVAVKFVNTDLKTLLAVSLALFLVPILLIVLIHLNVSYDDPESLADSMTYWSPSETELRSEIAAFKGSWVDARIESALNALILQFVGIFYVGWRALAAMLIGIAMFKTGFITAALKPTSYRIVAIVGLVLGVSITTIGAMKNLEHGFSIEYSSDIGGLFNYVGSVATAVAYIALVMLFVNSRRFNGIKAALANVGKMAFTNYIMQSLIATFVFYGFGLNYFAELSRVESLIVVLLVWLLQLVLSTVWLTRFSQGPLEKLWRSLTYR